MLDSLSKKTQEITNLNKIQIKLLYDIMTI